MFSKNLNRLKMTIGKRISISELKEYIKMYNGIFITSTILMFDWHAVM